ncbi:MAG TPA: hypothetical protein VGM01_07195 [Ktedonobacteraceae bacterium]|jgi:hypothetical protein
MNISREEAQASLAAIQQTRAKMDKLIGISGYFLIIWGLVWFCGCLSDQYLSIDYASWVWGIGVTIGWILSAIIGIYLGKQTHSRINSRIAFFFLALFSFAVLWFFVMQPASFKQDALFVLTIFLFGGVVSGIMTRVLASIISCLAIAVLVVLGYYLVPSYFFLWTAIFSGLAMFCIGLVMRLRWR